MRLNKQGNMTKKRNNNIILKSMVDGWMDGLRLTASHLISVYHWEIQSLEKALSSKTEHPHFE